MPKIIVKDFNLNHTLESGQLFRYSSEGKGWRVNHRNNSFYEESYGRVVLKKISAF